MPRKRSQDKDSLVRSGGEVTRERKRAQSNSPSALEAATDDPIRGSAACWSLVTILARQDGYLKIDPTPDGTTFAKWRFVRGEWKDHYVMVVLHRRWDAFEAFEMLLNKLLQVDEGTRRPTREDLGYFT